MLRKNKVKISVAEVDFDNQVVHLDDGSVCEIEMFMDKFGNPCCYYEAVRVSYLHDNKIKTYKFDEYDLDMRDR